LNTLFNAVANDAINDDDEPIRADTQPGSQITLTTIDTTYSSRQWGYQWCTEFGWYQTANDLVPMRPAEINVAYYDGWCERVFSGLTMGDTFPKVTQTTISQGGFIIGATNTIFTNGGEDPW
jgi:hypothetical protein